MADDDKRFKNEHLKDIPNIKEVTKEDLREHEQKIEAAINLLLDIVRVSH